MGKEIAYSEPSYLYTGRDFEKYNPDDLMGRKGYGIYKKMMLDEQVKAVVKFRTDSIVSRQFSFEIEGDDLTDEQKEERISVFETTIERLQGSWTDKIKGILSAIYCGFSMTEIVTDLIEVDGKTWVGLKNLKLRPFDTFRFNVDKFGNIKRIVQKISSDEIKINKNRFIHYVVNPSTDEHYGQSELREAYRSWFSKDYAIKFRNMWLERHAGGFRWAQPTKGATINRNSQEYSLLQDLLSNINTSTGAIVPSNIDLNSEYPANNVAFKEAIEDYNFGIAMALLVPNLIGITPQTQTGSYSQSEIQLQSYFETLTADIDRLADTLNEQLFRRLGDKNWGDGIYPKYTIKGTTKLEKIEMIRLWKELTSTSAVRSFPDDEEHIRLSLGFPPLPEDADEQQPIGDVDEGPTLNEDVEEKDSDKKEEKPQDETVMGKGIVSVTAFSKAQRRVDFAVIAKTTDSLIDEYTRSLAETMDFIVADLIKKGRGEGNVDADVSKNIKAINTDSKLKQRMNKITSAMLKEGVLLGTKHAAFEINKAEKKDFKANFNRIDLIADDYFKTTAFKMTGNLTSEAENIIEQEILNGARYDKTWDQIEKAIYAAFASSGMITTEQAMEALGEALEVASPDARLRTIVRTSTFDAINNARYSYFTDPGLDDFVQAFEYSAILDGRTTKICRHLDDDGRGNHSKQWYDDNPEYKPPNHFNCRSLLIPVTVVDLDEFEEGAEPTMQPLKGFR